MTIFTAHHSHEVPLHRRRALAALDRVCAGRLCDAIIAPSKQMRDTLVRFHGVPPEKVAVTHHGFELDRAFAPAVVDPGKVRAELGLDQRMVVTEIGRLYWIKNQEALVRAFAEVADEAADAVLLLVGGGDPAPILDLGRALGIGDRILVLPRRDDVPELLAATDLFVHPALAESFAMVIVEAMAMGCPVVSTPVGIAPDVVVDGSTGVLASDGRATSLAAALRRALSMRAHWPEMGAAARSRALDFPAAAMVRAYEKLYLELAVKQQ